MRYVYLLRSVDHPDQTYVGLTEDLKARLAKHNEGGSPHTAKFRPWKVVVFVRFEDDAKAIEFETYLKSGSGRAFAQKHLWSLWTLLSGPVVSSRVRDIVYKLSQVKAAAL